MVSVLIFSLLILAIAFMAVAKSWIFLMLLTMAVPVLILLQVWFVLKAKDVQTEPQNSADTWYENK